MRQFWWPFSKMTRVSTRWGGKHHRHHENSQPLFLGLLTGMKPSFSMGFSGPKAVTVFFKNEVLWSKEILNTRPEQVEYEFIPTNNGMVDWALNVSTLVFLGNAPTGHHRVCFFHPCFGGGLSPPPGWGTQRAFAAIRSDGGIVTWGQGEFGGDLSGAVREQFLHLWTPPKSSSSNQNLGYVL